MGKIILNLVNAKHRFRPKDPKSHGKGKPIIVPKYPPITPIIKAL